MEKGKIKVFCSYSPRNEQVLRCHPDFEVTLSVSNEVLTRAINGMPLAQMVEENIKHSVANGFVELWKNATSTKIFTLIKDFCPMASDRVADFICGNFWSILSGADIFDCEMFSGTTLDILCSENKELHRVNAVLSNELSVIKGRIFAAKRKKFYGRRKK